MSQRAVDDREPEDFPPNSTTEGRFGNVNLSNRQMNALRAWLPPTGQFTNIMEVAGYTRNLGRHVQHEGFRLMVLLAERGLLTPESDPTEVLSDLLDRLEEAEHVRGGHENDTGR